MLDKKYLKRVGLYVGGSVLALGVAVYLGYHLWQSVTREIETVPAVAETFNVTAEYDAWVFRDEKQLLVDDGLSGTVIPSLRDGERVGRAHPVGSLYANVYDSQSAELRTIRDQIRILEGQHTTAGGDLGIGASMLSLQSSTKNGDLSSAADLSTKLTALASLRSFGGGSSAELVALLREKENALVASFGSSTGKVITPYSGWYFADSDGYESVFTPDAVIGITPDGLDEILGKAPAPTDRAAGRIVCTYKWYIAANMASSDASSFEEGSTTEVTVPGITNPLSLTVESVVNGADGRTAVVFSCGNIPEGVDIGRHLTLDFTLEAVSGFGIPKEAVRMQDGVSGVFTYNGVVVRFRKIDILAEYDNMYVCAVRENYVEETVKPAETTGDKEAAETEPAETDVVADGTGRTDYAWLEAHEFIVVKGKSLYDGRVIG